MLRNKIFPDKCWPSVRWNVFACEENTKWTLRWSYLVKPAKKEFIWTWKPEHRCRAFSQLGCVANFTNCAHSRLGLCTSAHLSKSCVQLWQHSSLLTLQAESNDFTRPAKSYVRNEEGCALFEPVAIEVERYSQFCRALEHISLSWCSEISWDVPTFLFCKCKCSNHKRMQDPSSVSTHICIPSYYKTNTVCYKLLMSFWFLTESVADPISAEVVGRQCFERHPETMDSSLR